MFSILTKKDITLKCKYVLCKTNAFSPSLIFEFIDVPTYKMARISPSVDKIDDLKNHCD